MCVSISVSIPDTLLVIIKYKKGSNATNLAKHQHHINQDQPCRVTTKVFLTLSCLVQESN